jgi:hypothetical protein
MISRHKNATTTPGTRQRMSGSDAPAAVLALRYGVSEETARKWKRRDSVQDLSATPHNLQIETEQETIQWIVSPSRADGSPGGGGRSVAASSVTAARRSSGGHAGVPESGRLTVGPGSLSAAAWCEQSQGVAAQDPRRAAQGLQGIRTRLPACRCEVSATDGGRDHAALSVRGH